MGIVYSNVILCFCLNGKEIAKTFLVKFALTIVHDLQFKAAFKHLLKLPLRVFQFFSSSIIHFVTFRLCSRTFSEFAVPVVKQEH